MTILENRNELKSKIQKSSSIFIMGHKHLDLDAFGAAIGMYTYIEQRNIPCYIIIDDKRDELSVRKMRELVGKRYKIIKSKEVENYCTKKNLLIIVDTNKKELTQDPKRMETFQNIVVIDHHEITENTIPKCTLIINPKSSSTCEMVAELLEQSKISISPVVATALLAGIVLDTNNYVLKTTANTFRVSYFLSVNGADPKQVQYILKQDLKDYIERQKVITDAIIIKQIAISYGKYKTRYRREDLAKIADTLLLFNKIEASFVVGRIDKNTVGISARSLGNIDVGTLLEIFNGGGNTYEAAAQINNTTTKQVREEIMDIVKQLQ